METFGDHGFLVAGPVCADVLDFLAGVRVDKLVGAAGGVEGEGVGEGGGGVGEEGVGEEHTEDEEF